MSGVLVLACGSLGQVGDIPQRSLSYLKTADLVVFEEDRAARQLLKAAHVHREYLRLSEHRQQATLEQVKEALSQGSTVVYMSDQGMPNLADPGKEILKIAYDLGVRVQVIPGPSSITAALAAYPLPHERFTFAGFLPRTDDGRVNILRGFRDLKHPIVILETPYRLKPLLESCLRVFPTRSCWKGFLAIDITGPKETYWFGDFQQLIKRSDELDEKMNFVLIIGRKIES